MEIYYKYQYPSEAVFHLFEESLLADAKAHSKKELRTSSLKPGFNYKKVQKQGKRITEYQYTLKDITAPTGYTLQVTSSNGTRIQKVSITSTSEVTCEVCYEDSFQAAQGVKQGFLYRLANRRFEKKTEKQSIAYLRQLDKYLKQNTK
ncbi:MAG: DUF3284 domain-containing protein [Erysipelotrichaceae bacterium]